MPCWKLGSVWLARVRHVLMAVIGVSSTVPYTDPVMRTLIQFLKSQLTSVQSSLSQPRRAQKALLGASSQTKRQKATTTELKTLCERMSKFWIRFVSPAPECPPPIIRASVRRETASSISLVLTSPVCIPSDQKTDKECQLVDLRCKYSR